MSEYVITNEGETLRTDTARVRDASWHRARAKIIAENDICHLCGKEVDKKAKAPEPESPSIDHLIPFSKGGDSSIENLALAHLGCNQKRGKKDLDEVRYMPNSRDW